MAQKDSAVEQGRAARESLGSKAMSGAPIGGGGGVIVEVREKKGPLRAAIPTMPFPLAVICLFLNTFIPGLGKSGITLCFTALLQSSQTTQVNSSYGDPRL